MIYSLVVPSDMGDVEEVRVLEWHGEAGDAFAAGDLIVELETHKALVEVRAGQPGMLRRILCPVGGWMAVGQPLATLSDRPDEPLPDGTRAQTQLLVEFRIS